MARCREGDWFTVPLRDGGFAIGLVARVSREGVLLGYFFGPTRAVRPTIDDVRDLGAGDACLVGTFSHLGLRQGRWPILGRLDDDWDRSHWPMPVFIRYEELTGRSFRCYYDDDDPNKLLREEPAPPGVSEQLPKDGLMGAGFVEELLTGLTPGAP